MKKLSLGWTDMWGQKMNCSRKRLVPLKVCCSFALPLAASLIDGADLVRAATPKPDWVAGGNMNGAFGASVALVRDVNGDGFDDILVGAPTFPDGTTRPGAAFLFLGAQGVPSTSPAWMVLGDQDAARFGHTVASAGDVNGDGYGDVLVGAPNYDDTLSDQGRAYLYLGSASGLSETAAWMIQGDQSGSGLGRSLSSAKDVNGDHFGDVVVGSENRSATFSLEGRAEVFLGSASGLSSTPAWMADGGQSRAFFGFSVSAGNLDGDGFDDVVVGALRYQNGENEEGGVFIFPGSPSGPGGPVAVLEGNQMGAEFGANVDAGGDVNGDGLDDLLVGTRGSTGDDLVSALVYLGSTSGVSANPVWTSGDFENARLGKTVAMAGDVNADGFSELLVGDRFFLTHRLQQPGAALLYRGSASGPSRHDEWAAVGEQHGDNFGGALSGGGDVNGDGYDDILVGAGSFDNGEGRVYLYLGPSLGLRHKLKRTEIPFPVTCVECSSHH